MAELPKDIYPTVWLGFFVGCQENGKESFLWQLSRKQMLWICSFGEIDCYGF